MTQAPAQLRLDLLSDPARIAEARKSVEVFATSAGMDEQSAAQIGLCVNEALANIIRHAYHNRPHQPIGLRATADASELRIELRDQGTGEIPRCPTPDCQDPLTPGGLGLLCLNGLMDKIEYHPQKPGMLLVMTKKMRDE